MDHHSYILFNLHVPRTLWSCSALFRYGQSDLFSATEPLDFDDFLRVLTTTKHNFTSFREYRDVYVVCTCMCRPTCRISCQSAHVHASIHARDAPDTQNMPYTYKYKCTCRVEWGNLSRRVKWPTSIFFNLFSTWNMGWHNFKDVHCM